VLFRSGKEFIARQLHYAGRRRAKPFVCINCSALSESLLESELFGYARNAFKGALEDTCGRFQAADGGTLFLDEIGDISPLMQLKLTRVLQEKSIERLGESTPRKVDVRVIASTQMDLKRRVKSGAFREDLYHLLKLVEVELPPLRERSEDVPLLAEHLRRRFATRWSRAIEALPKEVLDRLMAYHWPGNIRELEYVTERLFLLSRDGVVSTSYLPPEIRDLECPTGGAVIIPVHASEGARDVLDALSRTYWNRTKAADLLGVSRQTLYRKIRAYKIFDMM
jgi:DNA-binding NtrC family response regulator